MHALKGEFMTQMDGSTGFRDRKGWLVFFGIVEIVMGLVCLLLLGVMLLAFLFTSNSAAGAAAIPLKGLIGALFMYGVLGAFFITMGIGSILARRWARAIMLMVSALWLAFGAISLITMFSLLPQILSNPAMNVEQVQSGAVAVIKGVLVVFSIVFFVILPGIFFLFYRSPNVKATCEQRDPKPRWTDRSLPVLSLSLVSGSMALGMVITMFINVVPFFGIVLTGIPAMIYEVTFGAVAAWGAWHLFYQRMRGWLAIVVLSLLGMLSWVVTLLRGDPLEMYRAYGIPQEQLQQMAAINELQNSPAYWLAIFVSALVWFGYLWFVRKALLTVRSAA
jgi:hypothetical protein